MSAYSITEPSSRSKLVAGVLVVLYAVITLLPLLIYTALLWGVGLYGGYLWAYQGLDGLEWPMRASVDTFWITSTAALALVSVLFTIMVWLASRPAPAKSRPA